MKTLVLLALAGLSSLALAEESVAADEPVVEQYHYGMQLDIAKVISTSDVANVCGVVPAYMTYQDHQGKVHRLEYVVLGQGCSNG